MRFDGAQADLEAALPADSVSAFGGALVAVTCKASTADMKKRLAALGEKGKVLAAMRLL